MLALAPGAAAGELDPPAGAVAPTMKDLDDVSPRQILRNDFDTLTPIVISSSGSYYLGEDIFALPNEHGIEIAASDVTLDLNGFTVIGNTEVGSDDGVVVTGSRQGVTIQNGRVRSFFGAGVSTGASVRCTVRNVEVRDCLGRGIGVWNESLVEGCRVFNAGSDGIFMHDYSEARDCYVRDSAADGFNTRISCEVRDCESESNTGDGFEGSADTVFLRCIAESNNSSGFHLVFQRAVIRDCIAKANNIGYEVIDLNNTIVRNMAMLNGTEFDVVGGNDLGTISNGPAGAGPWDNLDL